MRLELLTKKKLTLSLLNFGNMDDGILQAIEKIDTLLLAYQSRLKTQPENKSLKAGFNDLHFVKDQLWRIGKTKQNEEML